MRGKASGAAVAVILSLMVSTPVVAAPVNSGQSTWFTFTADAQGNYPGGTLLFTVFAVDSSVLPGGNESIDWMSVGTPWGSTNATSLPIALMPQESTFIPIEVQIPASYTNPHTFVASFRADAMLWNGTAWTPLAESGNATVDVLAFPSQSGQSTVSTTTFTLGVGGSLVLAMVLLVLLQRSRGELNRGTSARHKKYSDWK